jgi:hypothetical protein
MPDARDIPAHRGMSYQSDMGGRYNDGIKLEGLEEGAHALLVNLLGCVQNWIQTSSLIHV